MILPTFSTLGSGPTVLMLHGIGGGHRAFAPQIETFAGAGYRAVAWDMPGYGRSAPVEPYTFKALAQSCIELMEALLATESGPAAGPSQGGASPLGGQRTSRSGERGGHGPAAGPSQGGASPLGGQRTSRSGERGGLILLGHSMGGMVAQEVVARRPDLVRRLVLCGTSAAFGQQGNGRAAEAWARQFLATRTAPLDAGRSMVEVAQTLVPQMVGPAALHEGARLAEHCMGAVPVATYRRALDALVTFDRSSELAHIRVPTLLVGGAFDRVATPAVMRQMAARIAHCRYAELAGVGHLMHLEAPDEFDALVLNFLREPWPSAWPGLH